MSRMLVVAAAVLVVVANLVGDPPAYGQVELKWKLVKDQTFVIEEVVTIQQTIKVAGKNTKIKTKQTKLSTIRVLEVVMGGDEDGSVKLEMRLDSILAKGAGAVHAGIHKKMAGAIFQVSLNSKMQITKFEGYDALVTKVAGGVPHDRAVFQNLVTEETMRRTIDETFSIVPDGAVKVLDTWQRPTTLQLGPLGKLAVERTFSYAGKRRLKGTLYDKMLLTAKAQYQLPKIKGQTHAIKKANVKIHDYEGSVFFDATKGRLVQTDQKTRLTGSFVIQTPQGQGRVTLLYSRSSRRRVLDPKR